MFEEPSGRGHDPVRGGSTPDADNLGASFFGSDRHNHEHAECGK